jgi:hypothetical protein
VDAELSEIIMKINDLHKFDRPAFAKATARLICSQLQPLAAQQPRADGAAVDAELSEIIVEINDLHKFDRPRLRQGYGEERPRWPSLPLSLSRNDAIGLWERGRLPRRLRRPAEGI